MNNQRLGWGLALLGTIIFSTNTPISRAIISGGGMKAGTLAAGRFVLASIIFAVVLSIWPIGRATGEEKPLDRRTIFICTISGIANGMAIFCWYSALTTLNSSLAAVMGIALFPSVTLILLALGGERITKIKGIRLFLAMLGGYFLIGVSGNLELGGAFWILLAATCYGSHLVSVQWYLKGYNTWATTAIMMSAGGAILAIVWLLQGADLAIPGWQGWAIIVYQAVVLTVIGRIILYRAVGYIGSAQMALISPLETVLVIIWSLLFLNETLTLPQWFGAGLILFSAILAAVGQRYQARQRRALA